MNKSNPRRWEVPPKVVEEESPTLSEEKYEKIESKIFNNHVIRRDFESAKHRIKYINPFVADFRRRYPIDMIIDSGELSLALMLIQIYEEVNVLLLVSKAIWKGSEKMARKLLDEYKKDIQTKSIKKDIQAKSIEKDTQANDKEYLNTILHGAVCHNCPEIVKRVLEYGADPNIQHKNGRTVLLCL
jgi:predicted GNAT family acetyltransferase